MPNEQTDIRQLEEELFASMAKVRQQPLAPDPTLPDQASSPTGANLPWDHHDAMRMAAKARFPGLTDEDLDDLAI